MTPPAPVPRPVLALAVVAAIGGTVLRAQTGSAPAPTSDPGLESITVADLREHIGYLASDKLKGRATGTRGNEAAAAYIAKQFKSLKLTRVAGRGRSWYQPFEVEDRRYASVKTKNVLGLLEGTDPELKDQVLIVGGHFDHVGVGAFGSREQGRGSLKDKIHNGADDNASGSAGVLELAQAFAENPPRRSILFIAFSAEEMGLVGSYHYCREPALPLQNTVAMFNFDMIGRSQDDYLFVGGYGTSPLWAELVPKHLEAVDLDLELGAGGKAPSDNTPFYEKGLPVLFFHTNLHVDYHRVSDHAEFINYGTEARILRGAYGLIREVADRDERPGFTENDAQAMPADSNKLMRQPTRAQELAGAARAAAKARVDKKGCGRLGFRPAHGLRGELLIGELLADGPMAQAGLTEGDLILEIDGAGIVYSKDVATALKRKKVGERVAVTVSRDGEQWTADVEVGK